MSFYVRPLPVVLGLVVMAIVLPGVAEAKDFGAYGKLNANVRLRYESVDEEARPRNGIGNTVRMSLGYETPEWNNLYAYGELETLRHLGPTSFDDGLNGKSQFGRINDPQMNGINQLYMNYEPTEALSIRIGRQPLVFDNQRFVAWSKSRQNDITHDAILVKYEILEDLEVAFAHSLGMQRYSGSRSTAGRFEGSLNLLNVHYDAAYDIGVSGYSYWLDFDGVTAEQNLSSRTHGLRLTWEPEGDGLHPFGALEYAHQNDFGHSSLSYSENYYAAEVGARYDDMKAGLTFEQLGGNGTSAMQATAGSAHGLTGWTDKFSTIPADGLRDIRLNLTVPYELPWKDQSIELVGQVHFFTSDDGDIQYGREAGASLTYKPVKNHAVSLKYSSYEAIEFSSDTNKLWLTYEYKF